MKYQLVRIFSPCNNVLQHGTVYCAHTRLTVSCAGLIFVRSALIISRSSSTLMYLASGWRTADQRPTVNKDDVSGLLENRTDLSQGLRRLLRGFK